MFSNLSTPTADPLLGMMQQFRDDPSADKVDLGIGIYKDGQGNAPVLATVKQAESFLVESQKSKAYVSSAGNEDYNRLTRELILGANSGLLARSQAIQTPGGTGALRVAGDFAQSVKPGCKVFLPDPTWPNHPSLLAAAGLQVVRYPYYDVASGKLRFDQMIEALRATGPGDLVLFHGCCHNPGGADPSLAQWAEIAELLASTGATPLIDLAYLGFGDGLVEDAAGVRLLAERLPEMLIASSYSKNFALYRERVGALTLVAKDEATASRAHGHLLPVVRTNYSMPPDHGASVVAHILGNAALRTTWEVEVAEMRGRINGMREKLVAALAGRTTRDFGFLGVQRGMFAMLGITPADAERMKVEHHVHITSSGRVNVAGLTDNNVGHVANAIVAVCG